MNPNVLNQIINEAFSTKPSPARTQGTLTPPRKPMDLTPKQVIFNPPATIVYWPDGDKTVVRCDNDTFSEEFGYAMACMRKIYGSRAEFKAQFKNAFRPQQKPPKEKKSKTKANPTIAVVGSGAPPLNQLLKELANNTDIQIVACVKNV